MIFQYGFRYGSVFQDALRYLEGLGILDVIIPFFLVFAVTYGILSQWGPFRHTGDATGLTKQNKKINTVIALSIGLLFVIPHAVAPSPDDVVSIINRALPEFGFLLIVLVLALILTGLVAFDDDTNRKKFTSIAGWIALGLLGLIMLRAFLPIQMFGFLMDPGFQALVITLLVFALVVWFIVSGAEGDGKNKVGERSGRD